MTTIDAYSEPFDDLLEAEPETAAEVLSSLLTDGPGQDRDAADARVIQILENRTVGDALLEIMGANPARQLRVLSGHTHRAGEYRALPNLLLEVGAARLGKPTPHAVIEIT